MFWPNLWWQRRKCSKNAANSVSDINQEVLCSGTHMYIHSFITPLHMWHRSHYTYSNWHFDLVLQSTLKSSSYATYCRPFLFFQTPKEAKWNHFLLQHPLSGASALNDRKTVYIRTSSNSPLKGVFLGMPIPSWKVGIPAAGSKHRNAGTTRTQGTNGRFPLLFLCSRPYQTDTSHVRSWRTDSWIPRFTALIKGNKHKRLISKALGRLEKCLRGTWL